MNYDVSKSSLSEKKLCFEGCKEIPLDIDFTLPDYCPDVQKILKCLIKPNINSRNISGGQINVEGTAQIKILYIDADAQILRCCENSVPFSGSIDIKNNPENAILHTFIKTEYINCRAVSPRKIDLHGALSICSKVYEKSISEISNSVSGKDIEQKIETIPVSNLIGTGQQQFTISETLEIPENKSAVEAIIKSEITFLDEEMKIMPGKAVVKGKINLKILYISDRTQGSTENLEFEIPISQIVDVPGISEECECTVNPEILSSKIKIANETDPENSGKLLEIDMKLALTVFAFKPEEISIVSDVYSREYDVNSDSELLETYKIIKKIKEKFSCKGAVELPDETPKEIKNIFCDSISVQPSLNEKKPGFTGKVKLGILGINSDDSPFYVERNFEFDYKSSEEITENDVKFEAEIIPNKISEAITNDRSLEIKAEFTVRSIVYQKSMHNMITSVDADESKDAFKNENSPLTVYFPQKGESLWDIARKYHSSVSTIKEENHLAEDTLNEAQMILVPSK